LGIRQLSAERRAKILGQTGKFLGSLFAQSSKDFIARRFGRALLAALAEPPWRSRSRDWRLGLPATIPSVIRAVRSSPIFPATAMSGFEVEAAVPSSRAEVAFWPIVDVEVRLRGLSGPSANRRPISADNSKRSFRCYTCQIARGRATGKRQRKQSEDVVW
jgi:hypothetical protein